MARVRLRARGRFGGGVRIRNEVCDVYKFIKCTIQFIECAMQFIKLILIHKMPPTFPSWSSR